MYTGRSSVHWNATGMALVDSVYNGIPLEKLSWIRPTLECHRRNSYFCSLHWNTTGGTVTAHTRPDTYLSMQGSIHASLKWQAGRTPVSKWTGLCIFSLYLEFTALQWIPVLLLTHVSTSTLLCACLWYEHHYSFLCIWGCKSNEISLAQTTLTIPVVYIRGRMLGSDLT